MMSLVTAFVSLLLLHLFNRGHCQTPTVIGTTGGNGGNANCVFPFIYKGVSYDYCVTLDKNIPWCATTDNYDIDGHWGRCLITLSASKCAVILLGLNKRNSNKCTIFNYLFKTFQPHWLGI